MTWVFDLFLALKERKPHDLYCVLSQTNLNIGGCFQSIFNSSVKHYIYSVYFELMHPHRYMCSMLH